MGCEVSGVVIGGGVTLVDDTPCKPAAADRPLVAAASPTYSLPPAPRTPARPHQPQNDAEGQGEAEEEDVEHPHVLLRWWGGVVDVWLEGDPRWWQRRGRSHTQAPHQTFTVSLPQLPLALRCVLCGFVCSCVRRSRHPTLAPTCLKTSERQTDSAPMIMTSRIAMSWFSTSWNSHIWGCLVSMRVGEQPRARRALAGGSVCAAQAAVAAAGWQMCVCDVGGRWAGSQAASPARRPRGLYETGVSAAPLGASVGALKSGSKLTNAGQKVIADMRRSMEKRGAGQGAGLCRLLPACASAAIGHNSAARRCGRVV